MAIKTKTSLKSFFEKGDQPTSADFSSLVDTFVLLPTSGASSQTALTGFIEVEATASATAHSVIPSDRLPDASAAAQGVIEIATTAEVSAGTDGTRAITPGNLGAHPGVADAAIVFNGSAAASIKRSFNVSGVERDDTGRYTVTFGAAFSNTDILVQHNALFAGAVLAGVSGSAVTTGLLTVTVSAITIQVNVLGGSNPAADSRHVSITAYGL